MTDPLSKVFYVYVLFRPDGSPLYVGKGSGDRIKSHRRAGANHYNAHLARAFSKYGDSIGEQVFAEDLSEAEAFEWERYLIAQFGRADTKNGRLCNRTDGGEGASGMVWSAEHHEKRNASLKRAAQTPETKARMSAVSKKRWQDPEYRALQLKMCKDRWADPEYRERMIELKKLSEAKPENMQKRKEASAALWKREDYRKGQAERLAALWADPSFIEKQKAAAKAYHAGRGNNNEKAKEGSKAAWRDPERRERIIAAQKAGRARKKALLADKTEDDRLIDDMLKLD